MLSRTGRGITALGLVLVAAGIGGYLLWGRADASPIVGVVRATEVRVAPEVGGQLTAIKVEKGARVRAGDVVAELDALELTAAVAQARAELAAASASRDHVYAGVRDEEIAGLASEIAKAKSRLAYAQSQLDRAAYLARTDTATQQTLDQTQNDVPDLKRSAPSPTHESRRLKPRSPSSSGAWRKRFCARPPTAWSASSSPKSARTFAPGSQCWPSSKPASNGCPSTCGKISYTASGWEWR
jgi:multidrug resistance efflux pump